MFTGRSRQPRRLLSDPDRAAGNIENIDMVFCYRAPGRDGSGAVKNGVCFDARLYLPYFPLLRGYRVSDCKPYSRLLPCREHRHQLKFRPAQPDLPQQSLRRVL
jgi:hypothetical protein